MYNRPDRPLTVKCSLDSWRKKIDFQSARNCTYNILRHKVEQCFSLSTSSFAIAYKDDDGEITNITHDDDLTEAIQYFQVGDDAPLSSAASILSGRSFGSRKIVLRVLITVDYDGPSLSDTSSLASLDEYRGRNASRQSFSYETPSINLDDDSVTVSSRDHISTTGGSSHNGHLSTPHSNPSSSERFTLIPPRQPLGSHLNNKSSNSSSYTRRTHNQQPKSSRSNPFSDGSFEVIAPQPKPLPPPPVLDDPGAVFERLKFEEASVDDRSSVDFGYLSRNERGAAWLRDQNERAIRSQLGALPEPSVSDDASLSLAYDEPEGFEGALELERDPRGRYYYTYTSGGSSVSHNQEIESSAAEEVPAVNGPPRPTSMQLNWLAQQQVRPSKAASPMPSIQTHHSDPLPTNGRDDIGLDLDKGLLQFLPVPAIPKDILTACSNCDILLEAIRYICSTCGENPRASVLKGKAKVSVPGIFTYPPSPQSSRPHPLSASLPNSFTSQAFISQGPEPSFYSNHYQQTRSSLTVASGENPQKQGYELCSGCLESAGVHHAIDAVLGSSSPMTIYSSFPVLDAQIASQWRRAAPKKGQLRHAFFEKVWGHGGWEHLEQDEAQVSKCSMCTAVTSRRRYKCASCPNINMCRACYSQVHELHPSHAFVALADKSTRSNSDPDLYNLPPMDPGDEQSLKHPGVKCAHCMLDIVGARFHCAICNAVDICANCESAGLPGNLDSADGGHNSSHILIKIPYPLETTELESASRRAIHLWTGRDAASVGLPVSRSKPGSVISSYARTVVGSGSRRPENPPDDHHMYCNACNQNIVGIRFQCANCPSKPRSYNLCENCEVQSYSVHNPLHVFVKFPRPVDRPLELSSPLIPPVYEYPAGPVGYQVPSSDARAYLETLKHKNAICDLCMTNPVVGIWHRCAYCPRDLCDTCQAVDTHEDETHVFLAFKAPVDMNKLRNVINFDPSDETRPLIPYPVYQPR